LFSADSPSRGSALNSLLLEFVGRHRIEVTTPEYALAEADRALSDLADGRIAGAAVLLP